MKKTLPKRSLVMKNRLDWITKVILDVAKDKLAMVILFGSYARGDWVTDETEEGGHIAIYQSDFDIMLVMKKSKYLGFEGIRIEDQIMKRLQDLGLDSPPEIWRLKGKPPVSLIIESIESITQGVEKGRYFYVDVRKEGVMLYDSGEFVLPEPRKLTFEERKEEAQDDYDLWFYDGTEFLIDCNNALARKNNRRAAFHLHQATECFYSTILLVLGGHKPKLHDLKKLKKRTNQYSPELLKVFPLFTSEQRECFKLLQEAYIRARYDKTYKITEEQLLYLIERVEILKEVTEKICEKKLQGQ
jgi:HEPN domain-containing protein/predicted nucleotidyltransferase